MVNENIPRQGLLDYLTRTDEILIQLLNNNRAMLAKMDGGGAAGLTVPPSIETVALDDLRRKAESGEWVPYDSYVVENMSTAQTDLPITKEGDYIACWTNGSFQGIGVRFNNPSNPLVYFNHFNPIDLMPFWRIYLTYPVQASKSLALFFGRQRSARGQIPMSMGMVKPFHFLVTDKDTHFTGAIATNAVEEENLTALVTNKIRIVGVAIQSDQQLDYRAIFFSKDSFADTDLDVDTFVGEVELDMLSYGFQIAGANQWYMVVNGLSIDYEDEDGTCELHTSLQNLSAAAKNAGATGEVKLVFEYEERL